MLIKIFFTKLINNIKQVLRIQKRNEEKNGINKEKVKRKLNPKKHENIDTDLEKKNRKMECKLNNDAYITDMSNIKIALIVLPSIDLVNHWNKLLQIIIDHREGYFRYMSAAEKAWHILRESFLKTKTVTQHLNLENMKKYGKFVLDFYAKHKDIFAKAKLDASDLLFHVDRFENLDFRNKFNNLL